MRLAILYADLSTWEGDVERFDDAPCRGVLKVTLDGVTFSGWDHYGVMIEGGRTLVGVWKTDDDTDPYFGQGMVWTFHANGRQERTPYMPNAELPRFNATRRGQWVADDVARSVGLL
jgi:hypothetical protein